MEARRRVELTSTNRSIGLIALIIQCPSPNAYPQKVVRLFGPGYTPKRMRNRPKHHLLHCCALPAWWPSAKRSDPIPSRTRPSKSSAPMVLSLKAWKSRSPPGLPRTEHPPLTISNSRSVSAIEQKAASGIPAAAFLLSAARRIIGKTAPDWRVWKYGFVFVLTDDVHSAERIGGDTRGRRGGI